MVSPEFFPTDYVCTGVSEPSHVNVIYSLRLLPSFLCDVNKNELLLIASRELDTFIWIVDRIEQFVRFSLWLPILSGDPTEPRYTRALAWCMNPQKVDKFTTSHSQPMKVSHVYCNHRITGRWAPAWQINSVINIIRCTVQIWQRVRYQIFLHTLTDLDSRSLHGCIRVDFTIVVYPGGLLTNPACEGMLLTLSHTDMTSTTPWTSRKWGSAPFVFDWKQCSMVILLRPTAPQMYATPSHPENFVKWRVNAIIGKCVFSGFDKPFVA